MVGLSLIAAATPSVMQMTLAPVEAQARARNFSTAESAAVTLAGANEWQPQLVEIPEDIDCEYSKEMEGRSYDVTCWGGLETSDYRQAVARSFRLEVESQNTYTNPDREFAFETPPKYSHVECLSTDPWGVMWYNDHLRAGNLEACIPAPVWSEARYLESNPDDWLYDLSDHGFGKHPDY